MFESDSEKWWIGIVAGFLLAIISYAVDTFVDSTTFKALKLIGIIVGIASTYFQKRTLRPFVKEFSANDWQPHDNGSFFIRVLKKEHGKGLHSISQSFMFEDGRYSETVVSIESENGDVIIGANERFDGRLIIK